MIYKDRLLSLIASKTDIDPQSLRAEVITRFFEVIDNEGSQFIDSLLKFRDNRDVLAAIVIARLEEKVEEVVNRAGRVRGMSDFWWQVAEQEQQEQEAEMTPEQQELELIEYHKWLDELEL